MALAAGLGGCSAETISDRLPASMALPAGAPARPTTPYQYPAVHDMPPPRDTQPLTEAEQVQLEKELSESRDRQEAQEAAAAAQDVQDAQGEPGKAAAPGPAAVAKDKPAVVKKKKPAPAKLAPAGTATTGAKTSGAKTNP